VCVCVLFVCVCVVVFVCVRRDVAGNTVQHVILNEHGQNTGVCPCQSALAVLCDGAHSRSDKCVSTGVHVVRRVFLEC
jgi:hypothetical protein